MRAVLLALSLLLAPGTAMAYEILDGEVPTALVDDALPGGSTRVKPIPARPEHVEGATLEALLAFVDQSKVPRADRLAAALRHSPLHREADPYTTVSDPSAYKGRWVRQAFAAETPDGTRVQLYYHWLHESEDGWRDRIYMVMDGGVAHFNVTWDPKTKAFSHLMVNGEA